MADIPLILQHFCQDVNLFFKGATTTKKHGVRSCFLHTGKCRDTIPPMPFLKRSDATLAEVAPYRAIMPFLMPGRNESVVFFEQKIDLTKTTPFIEEFNKKNSLRATLFQLVLWAAARALHEWPRINRYIVGRRIYQRGDILISFSAKKKFDENAPLVVIKRKFDPAQSFTDMVKDLTGEIQKGRSDEKSHVDKELSVLLRLPRGVLRAAVALVSFLDYFNILPSFFTETDPMYASLFVANLGSLGLDAAYHHLYEYGTIPVFMAVGKVRQEPVATPEGRVEVHTILPVRYSYDERVEDGFYAARALESLKAVVEDPRVHVR